MSKPAAAAAVTAAAARHWADQIVSESLTWHRTINKVSDPAMLAAYEAGARQAAAELIATFALHGLVKS